MLIYIIKFSTIKKYFVRIRKNSEVRTMLDTFKSGLIAGSVFSITFVSSNCNAHQFEDPDNNHDCRDWTFLRDLRHKFKYASFKDYMRKKKTDPSDYSIAQNLILDRKEAHCQKIDDARRQIEEALNRTSPVIIGIASKSKFRVTCIKWLSYGTGFTISVLLFRKFKKTRLVTRVVIIVKKLPKIFKKGEESKE